MVIITKRNLNNGTVISSAGLEMREITLPSEIVVKASATTANLGLGFDVFGMALDQSKESSLLEVKQ